MRNPITDPQVGDTVQAVWSNSMSHQPSPVIHRCEALCGNLIAISSNGDREIRWVPKSEWCRTDVWISGWVVLT